MSYHVEHFGPSGPTVHILLVEDNPGDVVLTKEALEEVTVPVDLHVVEDGEAALDFLHQRDDFEGVPEPTLVLLDLNLPKKSGHEVLAEAKATPHLRALPIVVLSSSEAQEDIRGAYDSHANCYVAKPSELEGLVMVIQTIEAFWLRIVRLPQHKEADAEA